MAIPLRSIATGEGHVSHINGDGNTKLMKQIQAGVLKVTYFDDGPTDGVPVFLLHGFPYDVHSYDAVIPVLASHCVADCKIS